MSNDNLEEECPQCHTSNVDVIEYDGDTDSFLMKCLECGNYYSIPNDDGVWK